MNAREVVFVTAIALLLARSVGAQELYVYDTQGQLVQLSDVPTTPLNDRPVLFVHGHNPFSTTDADYQFRKDFVDVVDGRVTFATTLRAASNANLNIEPYFLRFADPGRSLMLDATEIRAALDLIVRRHVVDYDPDASHNDVPVSIIAYGKGAISARLALKSLAEKVDGLPAPSVHQMVSEFVAIAPPNHGITDASTPLADFQAGMELTNGFRAGTGGDSACLPLEQEDSVGFMDRLNGHPSADSHADQGPLSAYPGEAPGSRAPGAAWTAGVLYVALYAAGNRDAVGGDAPPGSEENLVNQRADCVRPVRQGRVLARNLSPDAINLAVAGIAGADPMAVHRNTVFHPVVICSALHTVVHRRPPTDRECSAGVSDTPIIAAANRIGVELVLDYSDSMRQPACPDCPPVADAIRDASVLFVDVWTLLAAPGDQLGVTYLRSAVTRLHCAGDAPCIDQPLGETGVPSPLLPVAEYGSRMRSHLGQQTADGSTPLGGALHGALTRLRSHRGPHKRVIVVTDAAQSGEPAIVARAGRCASEVCPPRITTEPPMPLDSSLGIPVDTLGVAGGDAAFELLDQIASSTGGVARLTRDPRRELPIFAIEALMDVLQAFGPQRIARRHGTLGEVPASPVFALSKLARRVVFYSSGDVDFRVLKDGIDVTEAGRRIARQRYRLWTLRLPATIDGQTLPAAGEWQVELDGKPGQDFEVVALVDEPAIDIAVATGARRYRVGDALELSATVSVDGVPMVTPVDVVARVWRPGDSVGNLIASSAFAADGVRPNREAGASLGEQNLARLLNTADLRARLRATGTSLPMTTAGSGRYEAMSTPLTLPGVHTIEFNVAGEHPTLGRFERSRLVTLYVGFGQVALSTSHIRADRLTPPSEVPQWQLDITPRDAAGNYLGPGFASDISVTLDGASQPSPDDAGDGRYALAFAGVASRDSSLVIDVLGASLFDGTVAEVLPPPPPPARPMWQYLVALFLVLGVLWWFPRASR